MSEPGNQLFAQRNSWIVREFVLCALKYMQNMDYRTKYGSIVCAAQSMDCTNPYFAPNIYTIFLRATFFLNFMNLLQHETMIYSILSNTVISERL